MGRCSFSRTGSGSIGEGRANVSLLPQRARSRQNRLPIFSAVEQAKDRDALLIREKGDRHASLEADDPQSRPQIISAAPSFRRQVETSAIGFEPVDIGERDA